MYLNKSRINCHLPNTIYIVHTDHNLKSFTILRIICVDVTRENRSFVFC